jgi:hypothetical protein
MLASDDGCPVEHDYYDEEVIDPQEALQAVRAELKQFLSGQGCGKILFYDPAYILLRLEREPELVPWSLVLRCGGQIHCVAPFFNKARNAPENLHLRQNHFPDSFFHSGLSSAGGCRASGQRSCGSRRTIGPYLLRA